MHKPVDELNIHFTTAPGMSQKVGTLAKRNRTIFFEYSETWLAKGVSLSPFTLPNKSGLIEHSDHEFGPIFGLFDDSLPDGWGLLLMDRYFRQHGIDPAMLSPLDRLAYLGSNTMGALTYHPSITTDEDSQTVFDLAEFAKQSQEIFQGLPSEVLPELLHAGGSPGGARPKVLVGYNPKTGKMLSGEADLPDGFEHWIIKFSARQDVSVAGPMEYAYSLMAKQAGIDMPETLLFEIADGQRFFGAKRFDRATGNQRFHIHTFGNMIHANFRIPCCDYAELMKATLVLTKNHAELLKVFRLMVFNVIAHNRDDHAKNFSFILNEPDLGWSFSPAYDISYNDGPGGEHTTTINGEGKNPTKKDILTIAEQFDIARLMADEIIAQVKTAISRWQEFADEAKLPKDAATMYGSKFILL